MKPLVTIRDAVTDPLLLGSALPGESFAMWRMMLVAMMGEPLTPDELAETFEPGVIDRSGRILWCMGLAGVLKGYMRRALLDADAVLPNVDVVALWCDQSIWLCVWAAQVLTDTLKEEPVAGGRRRHTNIVRLEGANHFVSVG